MRTIIKLLVITMVASMLAGYATNVAFATKSPYESGQSHGCDDAFISDPKDRYINGVNKDGESTGKSHHTAAFNRGYDAGFKECSDSEPQEENSDVTWETIITNNQEQAQKQFNRCGNIVIFANISCSNEGGQGQQNN